MTDPTPEAPGPNRPLTPEELASAPFVLAALPQGFARVSIATDIDRDALANWLHTVAEDIRAGRDRETCPRCAAGEDHDHDTPPPVAPES